MRTFATSSRPVALGFLGAVLLSASIARADPPPLEEGQHFSLDPISDGVMTVTGFGFAGLLGLVLGTGEIKPPLPTASVSQLLFFDRIAVTQTIDPHAATYSNIGLYTAIGFAVVDPVLSGFRDGTDALLVDAFMYAESGSLALTLTDITKIAVRRPRPIDYKNCELTNGATTIPASCNSTDLGLSFFSGHAAAVSAIGATATYLAFVRAPRSPRPWITLGIATALTAFVSYERVRAGEHFPSDVIAGSLAGAAVGLLVPHLHRHRAEAPAVWVGVAPAPGGGSLTVQGRF
ncbi:MAG: phosphatase PAP2 family protein [Polyangiaceae bacterium]|jgi:membrane-associated phospholipid phosphatase